MIPDVLFRHLDWMDTSHFGTHTNTHSGVSWHSRDLWQRGDSAASVRPQPQSIMGAHFIFIQQMDVDEEQQWDLDWGPQTCALCGRTTMWPAINAAFNALPHTCTALMEEFMFVIEQDWNVWFIWAVFLLYFCTVCDSGMRLWINTHWWRKGPWEESEQRENELKECTIQTENAKKMAISPTMNQTDKFMTN